MPTGKSNHFLGRCIARHSFAMAHARGSAYTSQLGGLLGRGTRIVDCGLCIVSLRTSDVTKSIRSMHVLLGGHSLQTNSFVKWFDKIDRSNQGKIGEKLFMVGLWDLISMTRGKGQ